MTSLIDISRVISPTAAVYPGDDPLATDSVCEVGSEAPCNITALQNWTTHFLTHVDPPRHFIEGGATLDDIPLSRFSGPALVVEIDGDAVEAADVPSGIKGLNVLFRTRNSSLSTDVFHEDHVYVAEGAVERLISERPNLVGIDYLSIDRFGDEEYPAHRGLLGNDILVLEGLDLSAASAGRYTLVALPLKIEAGDGSPVRAVLSP